MIRTDLIKQVEYDNTIYIFGEPFVIEPIEGKQYVVPNDYYNDFKELNPSIEFRAYNYNSHRVTKEPFFDLIDVVLASDTNAPVLSVMFSKGLCAHDNYMTLAEAKAVKNADLTKMFENNTEITHFEEFQYFTGVTEVGSRMFYNAYNLEKVILPPTCRIIRDRAFCFPTASLTGGIESHLTYVGGLENIEEIEINAFQYCYNIKSYNFTQKLKKIGINVFGGVEYNKKGHGRHTQNQSFGDLSGVEYIGTQAFSNQVNIKHLNVSKAKTVTQFAFESMKSLESIDLDWYNLFVNGKQQSDGSWLSTKAWFQCTNLERVPSMPKIIQLLEGTFYQCHNLKYVGDLPSCTFIDNVCFVDCYNLESIGDVSNVTYIGKQAFGNCYKLKEVYFPKANQVLSYAFGFENNDDLSVDRVVRFGLPYEQITFKANAFGGATKTTIYCNGVELTEEQYQALGATKPKKEDVEQPIEQPLN